MKRCLSLFIFFAVVLALTVIASSTAYAQRLNFTTYGSKEGLPQSQVLAIYQDSLGYLWFGTYAGASRYDGVEFITLDVSGGMISNSVSDIAEDANGLLYFSTHGGGISVYDGYSINNITSEDNLLSNHVNDLLIEGKTIYAAVDGGLSIIKDGTATSFPFGDDDDACFANKLYRTSDGELLVATDSGLYRFTTGRYIPVPFENQPKDPNTNDILADAKGNTWVCTSGFLYRLEDGRLTEAVTHPVADTAVYLCAACSQTGDIYFGTNDGIVLLHDAEFSKLNGRQGLVNNTVDSILVDREGNAWFGTENGISKLSSGPFAYYDRATGLAGDSVLTIFEDSQGRKWLSCENEGLTIIDGDEFTNITMKDGLPDQYVNAIAEIDSGRYLLGTHNHLCLLEGGKFKILEDSFGISCFFKDREGRIWMGTSAGPSFWENEELHELGENSLLSEADIICIDQDFKGRIWFGTTHGCIVLDGDETTQFARADGFSDLEVWSIDVGDDGAVWLGTNGDGAFYFQDGRFFNLKVFDGLTNNFVWQVLVDSRGGVWFGSNFGIDYYDGNTFKHFSIGDGLAANEGIANACLEDSNGTLWFCSSEGASFYNESEESPYQYDPPVYITGISARGKTMPFRQVSEFSASNNQIEFSFIGLSYRNEKAVRYRYKLEGLDDRWSESVPDHSVRYANISPGNYTFWVQASSVRGKWNGSKASYRFVILTPFYLSWWFISILVACTVALVLLAYRWRVWKVRRRNEELEQKVVERTNELLQANRELEAFGHTLSHDLNAPLRNIEGYAQILIDDYGDKLDAAGRDFLGKIISCRKRLKELISDLLRFSQSTSLPFEKTSVDLSLLIRMITIDYCRTDPDRDVEVIIQPDITAECSENLIRLSLENLVSNAWKYSSLKEHARIEFGRINENNRPVYFVRDNGVGFKPDSAAGLFKSFSRLEEHVEHFEGSGLGLATVKRIIERHGGKIWAEGQPGQGATFYFTLV